MDFRKRVFLGLLYAGLGLAGCEFAPQQYNRVVRVTIPSLGGESETRVIKNEDGYFVIGSFPSYNGKTIVVRKKGEQIFRVNEFGDSEDLRAEEDKKFCEKIIKKADKRELEIIIK